MYKHRQTDIQRETKKKIGSEGSNLVRHLCYGWKDERMNTVVNELDVHTDGHIFIC